MLRQNNIPTIAASTLPPLLLGTVTWRTHMSPQLPSEGAAAPDLVLKVQKWWLEAATKAEANLTDFDPESPLIARLEWAQNAAVPTAFAYARFLPNIQHRDEDQLRAVVCHAAQNGMYLVPEYTCVDRADLVRRMRRMGLERARFLLRHRLASVLLVLNLRTLFLRLAEASRFIQKEVVKAQLRAIVVADQIDTANGERIHGIMDEMLIRRIAENCRKGLLEMFLRGYMTGPIGLGYQANE